MWLMLTTLEDHINYFESWYAIGATLISLISAAVFIAIVALWLLTVAYKWIDDNSDSLEPVGPHERWADANLGRRGIIDMYFYTWMGSVVVLAIGSLVWPLVVAALVVFVVMYGLRFIKRTQKRVTRLADK